MDCNAGMFLAVQTHCFVDPSVFPAAEQSGTVPVLLPFHTVIPKLVDKLKWPNKTIQNTLSGIKPSPKCQHDEP